MTPFDKSTQEKAGEYEKSLNGRCDYYFVEQKAFTAGRNSAKESLEILAIALEKEKFRQEREDGGVFNYIDDAIAKTKERGDWPL